LSDFDGEETLDSDRKLSTIIKDIFMKVYSFQLSHAPVTNLDVGLSTHTIEDSLKDFYCDLSPSEIFEPFVMKVNDELTLKDTPKFNSS
jgi:hypothetical protein